MEKHFKLYTPEYHILLAEVFVDDNGAIFFHIKKSGKNLVEVLSLEKFLSNLFSTCLKTA